MELELNISDRGRGLSKTNLCLAGEFVKMDTERRYVRMDVEDRRAEGIRHLFVVFQEEDRAILA